MKYISVDPKIKSKRFWGEFAVEQQPPPRILEEFKRKADVIFQLQKDTRKFLITKNRYGEVNFEVEPERIKCELKRTNYIDSKILVGDNASHPGRIRQVFAKNFSVP